MKTTTNRDALRGRWAGRAACALTLLLAACAAPVSTSGLAASMRSLQEHGDAAGPSEEEAVHDEAEHGAAEHGGEHGEGHGAGTQSLNLFLGGLDEIGSQDGFAYGLDYEYRLGPKWGVGGFAEGVASADRSFATGLQVYWHAVAELALVVGGGAERRDGEWEPIVRLGGFYEFPLQDGWVISPALFYDITPEEDVFIYGFNVGYIW